MRRDSSGTKRKILTVCVRLFLEQGYKNTSVSQIVEEAGVARGSYLNLFPTKDRILLELTETMFGGQFGVARSIADSKLPPVYAYAVETAIQLTLTELNENLREIYIEAYSLPETSEYIYLHTTAELKQIFGGNFPDYSDSDFYEMEIGTAGLMRNYMARKCDIHFPLERKLSRFLTATMRVYQVPEEEQARALAFIQSLDIRAIATKVMYKLFAMLEMKYDFKLSKDGETEVTTYRCGQRYAALPYVLQSGGECRQIQPSRRHGEGGCAAAGRAGGHPCSGYRPRHPAGVLAEYLPALFPRGQVPQPRAWRSGAWPSAGVGDRAASRRPSLGGEKH